MDLQTTVTSQINQYIILGAGILVIQIFLLLSTIIRSKRKEVDQRSQWQEDITQAGRRHYSRIEHQLEDERKARKHLQDLLEDLTEKLKEQDESIGIKDLRITSLETQLCALETSNKQTETNLAELREELRMLTKSKEELIKSITEKNHRITELEALLKEHNIEIPQKKEEKDGMDK